MTTNQSFCGKIEHFIKIYSSKHHLTPTNFDNLTGNCEPLKSLSALLKGFHIFGQCIIVNILTHLKNSPVNDSLVFGEPFGSLFKMSFYTRANIFSDVQSGLDGSQRRTSTLLVWH